MSSPGTASDHVVAPLESLESPGGAGQLEPHAQALLSMLRLYTLSQRSARVGIADFAGFVKRYAGKYSLKYPQLNEFSQRSEGMVDTYLRMLAERDLCTLEREGQEVRWVFFARYHLEVIQKAYKAIEAKPELPFPTEEELHLNLPPQAVTEINIKTDFVSALGGLEEEKPVVLRLTFPDMINSMVVSSDLVQRKLPELAVYKLRAYMESRNNSSYVMHRLLPALRGHEHALRDMIAALLQRPGKAVASLLEPTDFSFRFWAHLANLLLQEFREVSAKTPEEHGYCQAAYLIGFYNVHYRGNLQKQGERERLHKRFEAQFRKYPYAYTLRDLQALRNGKGSPLVGPESRDAFLEFLEQKTKPDGYQVLPELVHIHTVHEKDYYVHRDLLVPLFVKLLHEKAGELRDYYVQEWEQALRDGKRTLAMNEDSEFGRDLDITLKTQAPFLYSLLNYNLLKLAKDQGKTDYEIAKVLDRCLDEKRGHLCPLPQILDYTRKQLLEDAKLRVPLWQRISLFKGIYYFFQRIFRRLKEALARSRRPQTARKAADRPGAGAAGKGGGSVPAASPDGQHAESTTLRPASAQQLAAYRRALQELKLELVGPQKTIPESLHELMEKWNPLYDPLARTDLVEDVNAMIRDTLRSLRRGFRASPPDAARIRSLAEKLSENKAFDRIKRKDLFVRYVEIYMLKLLGER
jgi:hypothetical protein